MTKFKTTSVMLFLAFSSLMAQINQDVVTGNWETDAKDARIKIFKEGSTYYGKLLWGNREVEADSKTSKKSPKNPDEKLRSRNSNGIINLTGLKFEDGKYADGKIYDPPSSKMYDGKAWIEDGNLHLRDYSGFSAFGKTAVWHKI